MFDILFVNKNLLSKNIFYSLKYMKCKYCIHYAKCSLGFVKVNSFLKEILGRITFDWSINWCNLSHHVTENDENLLP